VKPQRTEGDVRREKILEEKRLQKVKKAEIQDAESLIEEVYYTARI